MTNPVANEFVLNAVSMTNTQCAAVYLIHRLVGMLLLLVITELNSTSLVGRTEGIVGIRSLLRWVQFPTFLSAKYCTTPLHWPPVPTVAQSMFSDRIVTKQRLQLGFDKQISTKTMSHKRSTGSASNPRARARAGGPSTLTDRACDEEKEQRTKKVSARNDGLCMPLLLE